jgi:hypothetical protein
MKDEGGRMKRARIRSQISGVRGQNKEEKVEGNGSKVKKLKSFVF